MVEYSAGTCRTVWAYAAVGEPPAARTAATTARLYMGLPARALGCGRAGIVVTGSAAQRRGLGESMVVFLGRVGGIGVTGSPERTVAGSRKSPAHSASGRRCYRRSWRRGR